MSTSEGAIALFSGLIISLVSLCGICNASALLSWRHMVVFVMHIP